MNRVSYTNSTPGEIYIQQLRFKFYPEFSTERSSYPTRVWYGKLTYVGECTCSLPCSNVCIAMNRNFSSTPPSRNDTSSVNLEVTPLKEVLAFGKFHVGDKCVMAPVHWSRCSQTGSITVLITRSIWKIEIAVKIILQAKPIHVVGMDV